MQLRPRSVSFTALLAGLSLSLVAAACGSGTSSPSTTAKGATTQGTKLVYFIFTGYTPPYFAPMAQGIKDANRHYPGLDIKILAANGSGSTEISQIHEAVAAGAKGIILNAVDESVTAAAKQATAQGVPVVTLDRDISDPSGRIAFIGDQDVKLGQAEASTCVEYLHAHNVTPPWHVVDLQGTLGSSTAIDREKGIEDVLKPAEKAGAVKVALNQSANFDTGTAQTLMSEFLAKTHNIQLVLASNDAMALGAINSLKSAGLALGRQTYVCGADAQPESLADIKAGTQLATVTHSPYVEAFWGVEAIANDLLHGTKPPTSKFPNGTLYIPQTVVTAANVSKISGWGTPSTVPPLPYGTASSYPSSSS